MAKIINNVEAHSFRKKNHFFLKIIEKSEETLSYHGRLIYEFTAVDGSSLLIELLCMLCITFSVGFSLRLLNGLYPFPKYHTNFVSPLAELLGSFERNHCIMRRRLNPLFRLIFGQYSNFRGSQCIPRGYMDTRMT